MSATQKYEAKNYLVGNLYRVAIWLALILLHVTCTPKEEVEMATKPNVIFILADDLGYGDLTCYNSDSKIPTPHIDELAAQGILFTDVHTPSSVCTPTRYGLLTGRYAWRTRLKEKVLWPYAQPLIEEERKTLADLFKEEGYQTALFGKWHLGWEWGIEDTVDYNFEKFMDGNRGARGLDLTKSIAQGPKGAGFDYAFGVDYPNAPPYTFIENGKIIGGELPTKKPKNMFGNGGAMQEGWKFEEVLPTIFERANAYIDTVSSPYFMYLPLTSPHTPIAPNEVFGGKSGAGDYGDFIVETDEYVGELIANLKAKGQFENTLIIFTSDNGSPAKAADPFKMGKEYNQFGALERIYEHYPNAPMSGYKSGLYEGGHRVPFILSWPLNLQGGKTSDVLFGLQDLFASFHTFFGKELKANEGEDSYDVSAYLFEDKQDTTIREDIVMHGDFGSFAIRQGDWKFVADSSAGGYAYKYRELLGTYVSANPGQLYNLKTDPYEKEDLYEKHPEKVVKLRTLLIETIERGSSREGASSSNDPYTKEWEQFEYIKNGFGN